MKLIKSKERAGDKYRMVDYVIKRIIAETVPSFEGGVNVYPSGFGCHFRKVGLSFVTASRV